MPYYDSPSFFIDFSQVPPPNVIETIAYENILSSYKARVLTANPDLARALALEQSATNIILQTEAYGEMILRARVNAAARAVMLAFSTGTDLDNLATFYNVLRLALVSTPRPFVQHPEDWESDTRFRRRVQMAAEAFSTAGTAGSYIFHALTADPSILDVSATKVNNKGGVKVALMNSIATPIPTANQITNVTTYLNTKNRKVLTDVVFVAPPQVQSTAIDATLVLYPGPDASIVVANCNAALSTLRTRVALLGFGLERAAIISALYQEGVQNVILNSPAVDMPAPPDGCVTITSATINILNNRTT